MTTEGGVRVMMTVGGVEDQLEREARQGPAAPDHYRPCGAGWGGDPRNSVTSPESGALIGPDHLHGPAAMAGSSHIPLPARCSHAAKMSRSDPMT